MLSHEQKIELIEDKLKQEHINLVNLIPEHYKDRFNESSYIAGGCIYSLYNEKIPKDYDFLLDSEDLGDELREYFMDVAGYHGTGISGGTYKNLPLVITDNAISIGKYQIITRFKGRPEDTVITFDFCHNMFYWKDGTIETLSDFKYLSSKELKFNSKRPRDIVGTISRISKFVSRGMFIRQREVAKMLLKLHEVGFNERELEILKNNSSDKHFSS